MTYDEAIRALRAYNSVFDGEVADAVEAEVERLKGELDLLLGPQVGAHNRAGA